MENLINAYNKEVDRYIKLGNGSDVKDFVNRDAKILNWSRALLNDLKKGKKATFNPEKSRAAMYRPFTKTHLYYDNQFNEMVYQVSRIFPDNESQNRVICTTGSGENQPFSTLMINLTPEYKTHYNGQNFPLYLYETSQVEEGDLFTSQNKVQTYKKKDGITDTGLAHFNAAYPSEEITKEDVFYYVYGLLHSKEYREKYADNLSKQLPRIPCVKKVEDFWAFSRAGRALAELHIGYETVNLCDVTLDTGSRRLKDFGDKEYYVTKMKFAKKGDNSTVIYNDFITIRDIPIEAYDYVVNGKPALEWVMERQCVKEDKDSGIVNNANLYAIETVGDPAYPLKLFQRVITVSLETMKIVRSLPKLDIQEAKKNKAA